MMKKPKFRAFIASTEILHEFSSFNEAESLLMKLLIIQNPPNWRTTENYHENKLISKSHYTIHRGESAGSGIVNTKLTIMETYEDG